MQEAAHACQPTCNAIFGPELPLIFVGYSKHAFSTKPDLIERAHMFVEETDVRCRANR